MADYPTNSDYAGIGNKGTGDNPKMEFGMQDNFSRALPYEDEFDNMPGIDELGLLGYILPQLLKGRMASSLNPNIQGLGAPYGRLESSLYNN